MQYHIPAGIFLLSACLFLLIIGFYSGEEEDKARPDIRELIDADERMTFEVRYGFLRLGDVHVYLKQDTVYRGTPAVHMVTEMVSNRRLPLVGNREVHYHNFMAINDSIPYGIRFWQNSIHKDMMDRYVIDFDYEGGHVYSYEDGEMMDTLKLNEPSDGGPSVMYYARLFAGTDQTKTYPIYIDHERDEIRMDFSSQTVSYSSPAFPEERVTAYVMEGYAGFDGPFGFTGEFSGLFRDDELRIPLEARVSIWVGSVRVRLKEYERLN